MLNEKIAKIRKSIQSLENVPDEILSSLADAEREAQDVLDSLKAANSESKQRKLKIKELENNNVDAKELQEELAQLKQEKQKLEKEAHAAKEYLLDNYRNKAKSYYEKLAVNEKDPAFPKVQPVRKDVLLFENEKVKPLENYSETELKALIEKSEILEKAGFFDGAAPKPEAVRSSKAVNSFGKIKLRGFKTD